MTQVYCVIPAAPDVCPHPGRGPGDGTSVSPSTRTRSPQPIKLRETGRPTGMPVPEGGLIRCCLPAAKRIASRSVHKHVDDLCATMPNLCVLSGNAGDSAA